MKTSRTVTEPRGPLVSAAWLASRLGDPGVKIIDTRFSLSDTAAGREAYDTAHLPGAVYLHLDDDLSGPVTPTSGRHPLPAAEDFADRLGAAGIRNTDTVVAYDAAGGAIAARFWWMLRWLGHERAAILDGGFPAWTTGGYPVSSGEPSIAAEVFTARPRPRMVATAEEVLDSVSGGGMVLVDARETERYRGLSEPIDAVAGRIPGALNFPFSDNLTTGGRLLPGPELRRRWLEKLSGREPEQVVCMCGSGVTACLDLLAMELAGLEGARLYAGSWSEWIRDPDRPVAGISRRA